MKKFVSGLIIGSIVTTTISTFAGGVWDKIDVLKNDINIMVNGKQIFSDNFLYNDTTYLPLRTIAEELGQKVTYDEATNTAHIGSVPENNVVAGGSVSSVPDTLWIEKDGKRYTNDEFQLEIYEIPNDIKPCDSICIEDIEHKAEEIENSEYGSYFASEQGIYNHFNKNYEIKFNGSSYSYKYHTYISVDYYYSNIQEWLRNVK